MAAYFNMETLKFLMFNVHKLEELLLNERYNAFDKESILLFLQSVADFSDQDLYPIFKEMDEKPAKFSDGKIHVHPKIKDILIKQGELGIIGASFDESMGGLQLPATVMHAAYFIMEAANNHIPGYAGLTAGAAHLISSFAETKYHEQYVPNMLSGQWSGTMCLSEPQAGSGLSDIKCSAKLTDDGTYRIKGHKIFISGGDHEYAGNIIHLLLARIEGAPAGTKGISLFIVPKYKISPDQTLENNDVITAGDFQKMGQRGYCTAHLVFGDHDDCAGYLVGEENKGLLYMFQMMNDARIAVGRGGAAIASAAYYASLQYAQERQQGRRMLSGGRKDEAAGPTLIINHPDVRRMLFLQKAIYEGSLSLILQSSVYHDREISEKDNKKHWNLLLEFLTPITKTYPSEKGKLAVDNGLQILGGYGFCADFILQQYYRDIRIMSIYEGTTGIQSLDLLGRKVLMENGLVLKTMMAEMLSTISEGKKDERLMATAKELEEQLPLVEATLAHLIPIAMKGETEKFVSDATLFMEAIGTIVVAWQWLKIGITASNVLNSSDVSFSASMLKNKLHTMRFFYKYELARNKSIFKIIQSDEVLTLAEDEAFPD
jgi:butyryl-CoA dehydrogenase